MVIIVFSSAVKTAMNIYQNGHSYFEKSYANNLLVNGNPHNDEIKNDRRADCIIFSDSLGTYCPKTEKVLQNVD